MKRLFRIVFMILKSREFWICIIFYPLMAVTSALIVKLALASATEHYTLYGTMCLLAAALLVLVTVWEVVSRLLNHRIQGEHLKIRREKGIDIPDGIKDRNAR